MPITMAPAFALSLPSARAAPAMWLPSALDTPRHIVSLGRKRARALIHGAEGAFRDTMARRGQLEELYAMNGAGMFGGVGKGYGGSGRGRWEDEEEGGGDVDPSWGAAPSVHVLMRERCDEAYRVAVANLVAMSAALGPKGSLVGDPSVPVVLILSWMGAHKKHLKRYMKFYEDLGYEVHCVMNGLRTAVFPPVSKGQAKKVSEFIERQPEDRPVLIHAISIGTGIYGLVLDSLRHETEKLDMFRKKVVGVVFDSGPAPIFPHDVAKGLHTVCPIISKAIWEPIAKACFWVTKARHAFGRSEEALRGFQFPVPQLYFYSGDDKVIPGIKSAVEEFIEKNRQRGVEVYNKFWEKSVHASHLRVHPEEYLQNLSAFVTRCMELREKAAAALPKPVTVP